MNVYNIAMKNSLDGGSSLDGMGLGMTGTGAHIEIKQHTAAVNIFVYFAIVVVMAGTILTFFTNNQLFFWLPTVSLIIILSYALFNRSELFFSEKIVKQLLTAMYGHKGSRMKTIDEAEFATYQLPAPKKHKNTNKNKKQKLLIK